MDSIRTPVKTVRALLSVIAQSPALFLVISPCTSTICHAQFNDDLYQRFLLEAPPAWEIYQRDLQNFSANYIEKSESIDPTSQQSTTAVKRVQLDIRERNQLFRSRAITEGDSPFELHIVANADYYFAVKRSLPDGVFRVSNFNAIRYPNNVSSLGMRSKWLKAPLTLEGNSLIEVLVRESVRLHKISTIEFAGDQLVELQFLRDQPDNAKPLKQTVTLDPQHHWLVRQSTCERSGYPPRAVHHKFRYARTPSGTVYPQFIEVLTEFPTDPIWNTLTTVSIDPSKQGITQTESPEAFRLSAYGFEEPRADGLTLSMWLTMGLTTLAVVTLLTLAAFQWRHSHTS